MNIHEQDTNTSLLSTHQGTNPPLTNQPQEVKCHSSMHQSYQAVSNPRTSENSLPSKKNPNKTEDLSSHPPGISQPKQSHLDSILQR